MADSPKLIEERYHRFLNALQTLAPTKSFGGITIAELQAQIAASDAPREQLEQLEDQRMQILATRETADKNTMFLCDTIVKSVIADPEFGDDSALYEALGYVRKSDRKSGLTRKKNEPVKT